MIKNLKKLRIKERFSINVDVVLYLLHTPKAFRLLKNLNFWHEKSGDGFYKFQENNKNPLCRPGDTWCSQLGVAERSLKRHKQHMIHHYRSKQDFEEAADKFHGKIGATYYDHKLRGNRYIVNPACNLKHLMNFLGCLKAQSKAVADRLSGVAPRSDADKNSLKSLENKGFEASPHVRVARAASLKKEKTKEKTNLERTSQTLLCDLDHPDPSIKTDVFFKKRKRGGENNKQTQPEITPDQWKLAQDLQKTWGDCTQSTPYKLTVGFAHKLLHAFKTYAGSIMENWKALCLYCAKNAFLSGRVSKFRAWLSWVIRPEIIDKIRRAFYGGERPDWEDHEQKAYALEYAQKMEQNKPFQAHIDAVVGQLSGSYVDVGRCLWRTAQWFHGKVVVDAKDTPFSREALGLDSAASALPGWSILFGET